MQSMGNKNESGVSSGQAPGFVTLKQHEALIDRLDRVLPVIDALGELVVEADYVSKAKRLNKNTISQNKKLEKFNGLGERKVLLKLSSIPVIKQRKRRK
jgi:hypothetical protein